MEQKTHITISTVSTLIGIIAVCFSVYFFLEERHASKSEFSLFQDTVLYWRFTELYEKKDQEVREIETALDQDEENFFLQKTLDKGLREREKYGRIVQQLEQTSIKDANLDE